MLISDNLKQNFYQVLKGGRVLILAANDVDSLCASKILQALLQGDGVMYTLIPVSSLQSLGEAFTQHYSQADSVVTINCGGANPLQEVLELSPVPDLPIFVIDSHRPLDLENVYGSDQVKIVLREGDTVSIPKLDEISREQDEAEVSEAEADVEGSQSVSESEQEGDDSLEPRAKRQRVSVRSERREKREWTHRREDLLFRYYEFSYFDTCSSLVLYDTAWKLSKDSPQTLWWAIVGLTDQLLHQRVGKEKYVSEVQELQHHVARHNRFRGGSDGGGGASGGSGAPEHGLRLSFSNELRLCLHRHWTFFESLSSSDYTTCRFRLWTQKGRDRMLECLADMGLPLVESHQKFSAMDFHLREKVPSLFEKLSHKYGLSDLTYGSFHAAYGYRAKLSAADMALSCAALIESNHTNKESHTSAPTPEPTRSPLSPNNFLVAQDALSRDNFPIVMRGIEEAKSIQALMRTQIQSCMDRRLVICLGAFMYACLDESTPSVHLLSTPLALRRLSLFIRHAWSLLSKRSRNLPFILSAPSHRLEGYCLLLGLPPLASDDHKNDMGRAFKYTSERLETEAVTDQLDPCTIELKLDERGKFLDHLEMLLAH